MGLSRLREEIDRIDREIIGLLRRRFEIVGEVARLKKETNTDIEDNEREAQIIENAKNEGRGEIDEAFVEELMGLVISESKKIQEKMK
jgi:chorismate mutase